MAAQESVKLDKDVLDIVRQIGQQTGRSLTDVLKQAVMLYSAAYLDGYSAGGKFFGKQVSAVKKELTQ